MTAESDMAVQAAEMVFAMLLRIHHETGMPLGCVLAGAHAQVVTMIAVMNGGDVAAERCGEAARLVSPLARNPAAALAFSAPVGRA